MPVDPRFDLHSDGVQDLLAFRPHWIIRWGISAVFIAIGALFLSTWTIKYPDIFPARITITTQRPPISVVPRASGHIVRLLSHGGSTVSAGQHLAVIENAADPTEVMQLRVELDAFAPFLADPARAPRVGRKVYSLLGDLQSAYSSFLRSYLDFCFHFERPYDSSRLQNLRSQIEQESRAHAVLQEQRETFRRKLTLAEARLERIHQLQVQGLVSENDRAAVETAYLETKSSLQSLDAALVSSELYVTEREQALLQLTQELEQARRTRLIALQESYKQLRSQIGAWEDRYVLKAPVSGRLTLLSIWSDNQYVQQGEVAMSVVPADRNVIGRMMLAPVGMGKVKSGQRVNIRLDGYAHYEFGVVEGRVQAISPISHENTFMVEIALPRGLTTSYGKTIPTQPELQGTADIVTEDLRLLWRLLIPLRYLAQQFT